MQPVYVPDLQDDASTSGDGDTAASNNLIQVSCVFASIRETPDTSALKL